MSAQSPLCVSLLLGCLVIFHSSANMLEVGKCIVSKFSGNIDNNMSFHTRSRSVLEIRNVRSLMDCVDQCMAHRSCHGSLYVANQGLQANSGRCLMMDNSYEEQEAEDSRGDLLYGKFVSLKVYDLGSIETNDNVCDGITCAAGASCYSLCNLDGDYAAYPYCIADNSDCNQDEEYTNIRHYFGNRYSDGRDNDIVHYVTYEKLHADSYLRIIYHTSMRAHYQNPAQCSQWYVTFNNSECSNPTNIRRVDYSATTGDMHRAATIDGTCVGLAAGNCRIDIRISPCPGYSVTDGYTGWHNVRQFTVMEIRPRSEPATKPCPGLSVFNYQYKAQWTSNSQHGYGTTIFSDVYKKAASDTNVRIKFQSTMRAERHSVDTCGRWAIYVDGSLCSPIADVVLNLNSHGNPSYHRNELKGYTLEGICEGLGVGDHTIDIRTIQCHHGSTQNPAYFHSGWNSGFRLHMEEVRMSQRLDAVVTSDHRILRNPFSNVQRWHWWLWAHGGDNQELTSFTYTKNNDWTGLRFTSSGDHRTIHYAGTSWNRCSRWWFQIDHSECSDPGPIEGVYHFNYETNYHHPMQVTGVCMGRNAGDYRISYHIGLCYGYSQYGEGYTGWGSSFHIIVEEVAFEETKTCANGAPMNCDN